ncbi:hypothetical protein GXP67_03240 [Rhodocytophaga rosea]|uniref:Uncharacterized protein n=1 Tax=Rhodocytophaga rosea TaxID=2704465 RepID=A0A6C0GDJ0_9BACT|nr:hypothetical protein [Rhodocytophaga rosea]QHT65750.1 hypothetical protein GXP67_03240 [Rhodocytophaga rosea]
MIDAKSELNILAQCDLLGLHRSVLYYQPAAETELSACCRNRRKLKDYAFVG